MASRTAVSALPWHQCSAATLDTLDVDRRAGVAVFAASALPPCRGASDRAFRHSGTRKRRYLSSIRLVAISGVVLGLLLPLRGAEAGVLCAVWNIGEEGDETASAYATPASSRLAMPLGSQGRRRSSAALVSIGRPESSDVHRMEKSSAGSMSMKDAVELLKDSPRHASMASRRSNDGATRALPDLRHPLPRDKLSLRDGDGEAFSMVRERERERELAHGEQCKRGLWFA